MTDNKLTDEQEIAMKYAEQLADTIYSGKAFRNYYELKDLLRREIAEALSEARKGMFTGGEVIHFAQRECANYDNEDLMWVRLSQYFAERKGRG